jgi:AcrR family transcriptional regulator
MTLAAKDPEERRRRILQASIEVLRARGFSGTRVADIAAAAGTSPALVLYHFTSLADVLVAALASVEDEFYDELHQLPVSTDPRDKLVAMALLAADGGPAFGDWQLWIEVWVRGRHDQRINELQRSADDRWRDELLAVVNEGLALGLFSSPRPNEAVMRLSSLMDGLAVQVVMGDAAFTPGEMAYTWLGGVARELQTDDADLRQRADVAAS